MFGNRKREREFGLMQVDLTNEISQLKQQLKIEKDKSTNLANKENEANKNANALKTTIGIIKNDKKTADKEIKNLTIKLKECEKKLKSDPVAQVVGFNPQIAVPVTPTPGAPPARLLRSPTRARRTPTTQRSTATRGTPRQQQLRRSSEETRRLAAMMHGFGSSKKRFKKSRKTNRKKTRSKKH